MKKITTRQLIIFYCLFSFSIKFLSLPALLSEFAGRDAWMVALFGTLLELGVIFLTLNVLVRGQDSDIYSDMRKRTTGVGAKIFVLCMLFIFIIQLFILAGQTYSLLGQHLFDSINIHKFLAPLSLMALLFCYMPARAIFRSGEIFWIFILIALALAVFPAVGNMRVSELSPVLQNGATPVLNGVFRNLIFFESAAFLLVFSGDIKVSKNFRRNFMITASIVGAFFVFFVFMCTALFGPLAPLKSTAIGALTTYSSFLTQGGRLDWVLVCIWLLLLLLRFGVTFYCAFASIRYLLNLKHRAGYIGFGIVALIYPLFVWVFRGQSGVNDFLSHLGVAITLAVLFLLVPLVAFLCTLGRKNNPKPK